MKNVLFVFAILLMAGTTMSAQKKCTAAQMAECKKKGIACVKTDGATAEVASFAKEADALAEANDNIKREVCEKSGKVAYYEKSTCEKSGKVAWEEVKYCDKSKKFTKVASASMERESMSDVTPTDAVPAATATATKKAKSGKCCASKAGKKSCSKKPEKSSESK